LDKITCAGCCKRKSEDERGAYQKVPTEDPDDTEAGGMEHCVRKELSNLPKQPDYQGAGYKMSGIEVPRRLHEALKHHAGHAHDQSHHRGEKATDEDGACVTFEKTFEPVLQVLERQNSMLRLGDHWHLLTRIVLNRTAEYLDVLEVYDAAIIRIAHLLNDAKTPNKDTLVSKIEAVKLELNALERLVKPFAEYVVPDLIALAQKLQGDYPTVFHHVKDIQNNMRAFTPRCTSLVSRCEHLTDEYDRKASDKTNSILNILTFITFVVTPMQLMTGLYGMNFKIIPELGWDYGYHYFWSLALTLSLIFALILVCLQRA